MPKSKRSRRDEVRRVTEELIGSEKKVRLSRKKKKKKFGTRSWRRRRDQLNRGYVEIYQRLDQVMTSAYYTMESYLAIVEFLNGKEN